MTTADWALLISLFSFGVSLAGFIWNVWSKFIFPKAKVRTTFYVAQFISADEIGEEFLTLSATNYGPGVVTLKMVVGRIRKNPFRLQPFMMAPLASPEMDPTFSNGPFSGGLPKKIDVGESFSSFFPLLHNGFNDEQILDIGFCDTFGRNHWARRRDVKKVQKAVREGFAEKTKSIEDN